MFLVWFGFLVLFLIDWVFCGRFFVVVVVFCLVVCFFIVLLFFSRNKLLN